MYSSRDSSTVRKINQHKADLIWPVTYRFLFVSISLLHLFVIVASDVASSGLQGQMMLKGMYNAF